MMISSDLVEKNMYFYNLFHNSYHILRSCDYYKILK